MELNSVNLEKAVVEVIDIAKKELRTEKDVQNLKAITNTIITSENFLKDIQKDIDLIMEDGKIDMMDIPNILSMLLKSTIYLTTLDAELKKMDMKDVPMKTILKYVSMTIFYYILLNNGAESGTFLTMYAGLWNLVEFALPSDFGNNNKIQGVPENSPQKQKVFCGC